jgi:hypothetical protein
VKRFAVLAASLTFAIALAACGQEIGTSTSASLTSFESQEYGFTLAYDESRFLLTENVPIPAEIAFTDQVVDAERAAPVGLVDKETPSNPSNIGASLALMVATMPFSMDRATDAYLRDWVLTSKRAFATRMPRIQMDAPIAEVVSGETAWTIRFAGRMSSNAPEQSGIMYFFAEGSRLYLAVLTSTSDVWAEEEAALREALAGISITPVEEEDPGAKPLVFTHKKYGFSFKYPPTMSVLSEDPISRSAYQAELIDVVDNHGRGVGLSIAATTSFDATNAESAGLDYAPVKRELAKTKSVSKVTTPRLVKYHGKYAWQYDYTVTQATGPTRFRNLDFWDGNRMLTLMLYGNPSTWKADVAALTPVAKTFTFK